MMDRTPIPPKPAALTRPNYRPLSDLKDNSLYLMLYVLKLGEIKFHWGLYLHKDIEHGGTKYHAVGSPGKWMMDHGRTFGACSSRALIGMMRIASIPPAKFGELDKIITEEDSKWPEIPNFTCRVYVSRACERLKSMGYISFETWTELQEEAEAFGSRFEYETERAIQPRPLAYSRACKVKPLHLEAAI